MDLLNRNYSVILLYHSVSNCLPTDLKTNLHNVEIEVFYEQVKWLKEHFDIIPIDNWFKLVDVRGTACITFDDAYLSVFKNALPFLINQNIPSTVFLNASFLNGKSFWRDKVRYLINNKLVDDFMNSSATFRELNTCKFYGLTKKNNINSFALHEEIDEYFSSKGLGDIGNELVRYLAREKDLIDHPLVTYGNHTNNHYVLSSLTNAQQENEIILGKKLVESLSLHRSEVFSVPFGGNNDVNDHTFVILRNSGYKYALLSGKTINLTNKKEHKKIKIAKRFMAPSIDFYKKNIFHICCSNTFRSKFKIRSLIK